MTTTTAYGPVVERMVALLADEFEPECRRVESENGQVKSEMRSFSELEDLFSNQSTVLWERLGYVRESIKSRGVLGPVRFGEETITDLLMMDFYLQGSTVALFKQTSKPNESMSGTDFELWLGVGAARVVSIRNSGQEARPEDRSIPLPHATQRQRTAD